MKYKKECFQQVLEGLLVKPTLKFSSPTKLNDVNEFKFYLEIDRSNPAKLQKRWLSDNPNKSPKDFDIWLNGIDSRYLNYCSWQTRASMMQNFNVQSFSLTRKSNLLWSHYADIDTGFCVIYKSGLIKHILESHPGIICGKVKYRDSPPIVDTFNGSERKILEKVFFTKEMSWKYEKEYRIVMEDNIHETSFITVPKEYIFGVIFGSRIDTSNRNEIFRICLDSQFLAFQASNMNKSYQIKVYGYNGKNQIMSSFYR